MGKSSRSDAIIRARDQLHDGLTFIRKSAGNDDYAQQLTSMMAAGIALVVGIALDLNRIADALERETPTKEEQS